MPILTFRFPGGRYHATPWGHHVNEGLVEWPPSPWRLLRALISVGYTRFGWERLPSEAGSLIRSLASVLPSYTIPPATLAHTRHYMPVPGGKPTLVMDAWAQVDQGELLVHWPAELEEAEKRLLANLVSSMNYLGRAESWVEGRVLTGDESVSGPDVICHETSSMPLNSERQDLVLLAAPVTHDQYQQWRGPSALSAEIGQGKQTKAEMKARANAEKAYPKDLMDALQWDTARWKSFGWSQAPGMQKVHYRRPKQALAAWMPPPPAVKPRIALPDMVLLAWATPSGNASALPTLSRTLPQAELLHQSLVEQSGKNGAVARVLSGCDGSKQPLKGHEHTHILPLDLDRDGHLDHALLWAPMGFDDDAMRAIRSLRGTWTKGGVGELRVAMAGQARRAELRTLPMVEGLEAYLRPSKIWTSLSPFVAPRFLKKKGSNSLEGQIKSELRSRNLPEPIRVSWAAFPASGDLPEAQAAHFRHYVRRRQTQRGGKLPPQDCGWCVGLEFAEALQGPLCLGYGSHFGLGMFVARGI